MCVYGRQIQWISTIKGAMSRAKVYCGNNLFTSVFLITRGLNDLSPNVTKPGTIVSVI